MIVVSDTSPILNLARIGRLELSRLLYRQVVIPPAVFSELTRGPRTSSQPFVLDAWISVEAPVDAAMVSRLRGELDPGEAQAITLAVERQGLLLIDERLGRQVAKELGLEITGLLGLVVEAKLSGLIPAVRPVLEELIGTARFWVTDELYQTVLASVGER